MRGPSSFERAGVLTGAVLLSMLALSPPSEAQEIMVPWGTSLPQALVASARSDKAVVVAFFATWCPSCRRFRGSTAGSAALGRIADRFQWVMVDIDREASLGRAYRVMSTPEFLVLGPEGTVLLRLSGAFKPDEFVNLLTPLGNGPPWPKKPVGATLVAEDKTPLTWSPEGYRGLSICFSHVGYGPLNLSSQSPFQSLRSAFRPRTPSTLTEGRVEARLSETWANLWASGTLHTIDYESLRTGLAVAVGLSDTVEVELELVQASRFGGVMDGLVQGFHDVFNIDQGGRDEVSKGRFAFDVQGERGERGSFSQEILLTLQHNVTCGSEDLPALSAAATFSVDRDPAEDRRGGSPLDVALSVAAARRFGDVYAYLGLGLAWFGKEEFHAVELRTTQASVLAAVEWRFSASMSLIVQYLLSEGVAEDLGPFSKPSHEVTLGWKGEIIRDTLLEVGLVENVLVSDNSPDFGIHAGLTWRF